MYRSRMSLSLLSNAGRGAIVIIGVLGLFTSVQIACTFSDEPPTSKKNNPVTDSGPDKMASSSGTTSGATEVTSGGYYGYGYGYGPNGCYGYGYGYDPTPYEGYGYTSSSGGGCN